MISLSELKRRLENIVQIGTIHTSKVADGQHLARVILDDDGVNKRVSPFLPVNSLANSFARVFFPIRAGEQVVIISLFGNANSGFIIRSIFHNRCKVPGKANSHTTLVEFEDGTVISYDTKASELKVDAVKSINVFCKTVNIEASTSAYLKAPNTTIESEVLIKGSLTVEKLFTAKGGMKVFALAGQSIGAIFDCDIKSNKDITALNLRASNKVYDSRGNLTDHTNNGYERN